MAIAYTEGKKQGMDYQCKQERDILFQPYGAERNLALDKTTAPYDPALSIEAPPAQASGFPTRVAERPGARPTRQRSRSASPTMNTPSLMRGYRRREPLLERLGSAQVEYRDRTSPRRSPNTRPRR